MRDVNMKVAVVYSGEPRSYAEVVDQHNDFFKGVDFETFHSTWTKTSEEDIRLIHSAPHIKNISYADYNAYDRPDLVRFEKLLLGTKQNHPIFMLGRIQHMTSQALNLRWHELHQYDYIVRMRYDFKFEGRFTDLIPNDVDHKDVFTTRKMGGKSSPINVWDGFAFGRPYAMSFYFDFNKWIPFSLFNNDIFNWKFQPEFVYGTYLRYVQLNVRDCGVQPVHVYPNNKDVDYHREMRTVQYYRDLATFHPEYNITKNGKYVIENDSPWISDEHIINVLTKEGLQPNEI